MPKQGNSTPLKVLMPSSFTSQQLVFLAGTLKPKGFVPCILAMREDCILGVCVALKALLDCHYFNWPLLRAFFFIHKNGCSQSHIGLTGISMGMSFPRVLVDCSDATGYKMLNDRQSLCL